MNQEFDNFDDFENGGSPGSQLEVEKYDANQNYGDDQPYHKGQQLRSKSPIEEQSNNSKPPISQPIHTRLTGDSVEKLRLQNQKLKTELRDLSSKLEDYLLKARKKKAEKQYGINVSQASQNQEFKTKQKQLQSSHIKIAKLKSQIQSMRRQLQGSYNIDKIVKLQDELRNKKRIREQQEQEYLALQNVQKEQEKAYKHLSKQSQYKRRIDELQNELKNAKDKLKQLQAKQRSQQKQLKEQHERLVTLEERNRRLFQLTQQKKRQKEVAESNSKFGKKEITDEDIKKIEGKIKEAQQYKLNRQKDYKRQIAKQQQQVQQLKYELKKIQLQTKEKDQEYRLNELKIRELRRQIQQKPPPKSKQRADSVQGKRIIKKGGIRSQVIRSPTPKVQKSKTQSIKNQIKLAEDQKLLLEEQIKLADKFNKLKEQKYQKSQQDNKLKQQFNKVFDGDQLNPVEQFKNQEEEATGQFQANNNQDLDKVDADDNLLLNKQDTDQQNFESKFQAKQEQNLQNSKQQELKHEDNADQEQEQEQQEVEDEYRDDDFQSHQALSTAYQADLGVQQQINNQPGAFSKPFSLKKKK